MLLKSTNVISSFIYLDQCFINVSMEFSTADLIKVTLHVTTNLVYFGLTQPFKTLYKYQERRKQARIGTRRNYNLSKQLLLHVVKVFVLCQCVQQVSTQKPLKGKNMISVCKIQMKLHLEPFYNMKVLYYIRIYYFVYQIIKTYAQQLIIFILPIKQ